MRRIGFIVIVLLFIGCSNKKSQESVLLNEEKMVELLTDMYITDAMLTQAMNRSEIVSNEVDKYYKGLLEKYHINRREFDSVYEFYTQDYERFQRIYSQVLIEIKRKQEKLEAEKRKEKK